MPKTIPTSSREPLLYSWPHQTLDDVFPFHEDDDWDTHAEQPEDTTTTEEPRVVDEEVWTGNGLLERLEALRQEFVENVLTYVRKFHHGMGHPSNVVQRKRLRTRTPDPRSLLAPNVSSALRAAVGSPFQVRLGARVVPTV